MKEEEKSSGILCIVDISLWAKSMANVFLKKLGTAALQVIRDQDDKPIDGPFANPGNGPTETPCLYRVPANDPGSQPLRRRSFRGHLHRARQHRIIPSQTTHLTVDRVQTARKAPLGVTSDPEMAEPALNDLSNLIEIDE